MTWNIWLDAYHSLVQPIMVYLVLIIILGLLLIAIVSSFLIIMVGYRKFREDIKNYQDKYFRQELDKIINSLLLSIVTISFLLVTICNILLQFYICLAIVTGIWFFLMALVGLKDCLLTWWKSRGD